MVQKESRVWARFGAEVKRLRSGAGITQVRLGGSVNMSDSLISAIENGTRAPKREYAEALDAALSTGGTLTRLWLDLNDSLGVPEWWRDISLLERAAVEIREYQMVLIPGLLQTADYARTAMRAGRLWDPDEVIERDVEARVSRLRSLQEGVFLWFVVDEFALRRVVGDTRIMNCQLDRVLSLIEDGTIRLQIIPQHAPQHPGMSGGLRILSFTDRAAVALAEHLVGEEIVDNPEGVRRCSKLYGALQAEALSPTASVAMLQKIRKGDQ
ncbi:helix-turn-helix domain-containing protein [Marinitenerispora sediminis]|uniref:HTH cro/C1-type domain-containing protein n=1 Tax=Marinitenerispora sediminis TaxID=1931232 RepID=A0A368TAI4_9ACTN|nr:helix-turn-helix transcriptional regulator [Marinitenerispora sediminis]RCV55898.1 hypothetical protein DEF28_04955 [Marinitenerispora sediminis]RCV61979.1 hypothetical protein DEF24_02785 [Marinitenerispora sediminis]RCV62028.1 hypothetical protein DEF23_00705 [Marinitenerispora sediminis]